MDKIKIDNSKSVTTFKYRATVILLLVAKLQQHNCLVVISSARSFLCSRNIENVHRNLQLIRSPTIHNMAMVCQCSKTFTRRVPVCLDVSNVRTQTAEGNATITITLAWLQNTCRNGVSKHLKTNCKLAWSHYTFATTTKVLWQLQVYVCDPLFILWICETDLSIFLEQNNVSILCFKLTVVCQTANLLT